MNKTREEKIQAFKDLIKSDDIKLGLDSSYTLEQFESDMENASPDQMEGFLMKAIDNFNVLDPLVNESLQKYRDEIQDIKDQMAVDLSKQCDNDIASGKLELYTCVGDIEGYSTNQNYYVKIDDVRAENLARFENNKPSEALNSILERINNMTPQHWVYSDGGIGTLTKKKYIPEETFSKNFVKYQNK
jgi:hypothetical protein